VSGSTAAASQAGTVSSSLSAAPAPPLTSALVATRVTALDGNPSDSVWRAVDGDPATASAATGSRRFRLQFSGRETLSSVAVLSSAEGAHAIEADDDTAPQAISGLEHIAVHGTGSSRWLRTSTTAPYVTGTVLITWTPASADAPMPEIALLGRTAVPALRPAQPIADQLTAGVAHPRIDITVRRARRDDADVAIAREPR
jgi:hypothetical protein